MACQYRKVFLVRYCVEQGADPNISDDRGLRPVHRVIGETEDFTEVPEVVEILKILVDHQAMVQAADETKKRRRAVHLCAATSNHKAVRYLLERNPQDVNVGDAEGRHPLDYACDRPSPNKDMVAFLLIRGATFGTKTPPPLRGVVGEVIRKLLNKEGKKRRLYGGSEPCRHLSQEESLEARH